MSSNKRVSILKRKEGAKMKEKEESSEGVYTNLIWDCHEEETKQSPERCKKCLQNIGGEEEIVCLKDVLW